MRPLDLIKIYTQTGNMLYRLAPPQPGNPIGSQNPIDTLQSTLGSVISAHVQSLELFYMELERITGISQTAMSSLDPNQGLGVSQISIATTTNTLKPILVAWQTLKSNAYAYCANKIQSVIVNNKENPYSEILGVPDYVAIKSAGDNVHTSWGMFIKAKIDRDTKASLLEAARNALAVGKDGVPILSFSDYLYVVDSIDNGGNVSAIRAFIAYKEQSASAEAFQRAQASMQNQSQLTDQTNQLKMQWEDKRRQDDYNMAVGKIREQFQADAMLKKLEASLKRGKLDNAV
jgi:hypothetical protein